MIFPLDIGRHVAGPHGDGPAMEAVMGLADDAS